MYKASGEEFSTEIEYIIKGDAIIGFRFLVSEAIVVVGGNVSESSD